MARRSVTRSLVGAAAGVALAVPGAAFAQTLDHRDARHDVVRLHRSGRISLAPHNGSADIVHTRVAYTRRHLATTIRLRSGTVPDSWLAGGRIRTGSATYEWFGSGSTSGDTLSLQHPDGRAVTCEGITDDVARTTGRITVTIPSSCLGRPAWTRVGVGFSIDGSRSQLIDDGLRTGGPDTIARLALSPRLHHA